MAQSNWLRGWTGLVGALALGAGGLMFFNGGEWTTTRGSTQGGAIVKDWQTRAMGVTMAAIGLTLIFYAVSGAKRS